MKIRSIAENYEGLPDEDQFVDDLICAACGAGPGEYGLFDCENCGSYWCKRCLRTDYDIKRFTMWHPNGEIAACFNCPEDDIVESYAGLPDEDEFNSGPIDIFGPCENCFRTHEQISEIGQDICESCGSSWCNACIPDVNKFLQYNEHNELVRCYNCTKN